jgi:hypothetical protein
MTALLAACARACRDGKSHADPDLRPWGGGYWFQNTRHMYWYALGAGDLDLLDPLFGMYMRQLPLLRERTQQWYVILSSVANSEVGANVAFDCNHSLLSYERKRTAVVNTITKRACGGFPASPLCIQQLHHHA